jgi:hypothetical protein
LNNPGVNHHREVVSFVREIIETHPEVESLKDCARRPAAVTKALSFEPAKDRLTQLGGGTRQPEPPFLQSNAGACDLRCTSPPTHRGYTAPSSDIGSPFELGGRCRLRQEPSGQTCAGELSPLRLGGPLGVGGCTAPSRNPQQQLV